MKNLSVSILGWGMMGRVRAGAYESLIRNYGDCPIQPVINEASVLDNEVESARKAGWAPSTNLDAVITNPKTDYIDICLPNAMHADAAIKALNAGKHCFCEKPLSVTLDEGRRMVEAAEKNPKLLNSVNFIYRRCPANVFARKIATEKTFGKLVEARMYYQQAWGGPGTGFSWRFDKSKGGGTMSDLGSHAFDMLFYVTGERPSDLCALKKTHVPKRYDPSYIDPEALAVLGKKVVAQPAAKMRPVEVDDSMKIIFNLPGGGVGSLECARNACGTENTHGYELYFENGALKWCYDDVNYINVYDARGDYALRGWNRVCCNRGGFAYATMAGGHMEGYRDFTANGCFENMRVIDALQTGAEYKSDSPVATFRDAFDVQRTIFACYRSADERRWVELDEIQ